MRLQGAANPEVKSFQDAHEALAKFLVLAFKNKGYDSPMAQAVTKLTLILPAMQKSYNSAQYQQQWEQSRADFDRLVAVWCNDSHETVSSVSGLYSRAANLASGLWKDHSLSSVFEQVSKFGTALKQVTETDRCFRELVFKISIFIAELSPRNGSEDPISYSPIPTSLAVHTSTGHNFDVRTISAWLNTNPQQKNPSTNVPFNSRDIRTIQAKKLSLKATELAREFRDEYVELILVKLQAHANNLSLLSWLRVFIALTFNVVLQALLYNIIPIQASNTVSDYLLAHVDQVLQEQHLQTPTI